MQQTERASTILLVDDDATLRDVLGRVLTRDGYAVVPAAGVAEALDLARQHTLSLGLLDLSLPDGDGVGLADSLRERQADLPLILMTAYPIRLRENPDIGSRFRRVMSKPLNLAELRTAVQEALRGEPAAKAPSSHGSSEATAPSPEPARAVESPAAPPPLAPHPHDRWHWVKSGAMVTVALAVLAVFLVYISGVPIPGLTAGPEATASAPSPLDVELAKDMPYTLVVPDDVKKALGIRQGDKDDVATAAAPTETRPLVLTGSTALDPDRILHVRARFAPATVVEIGSHHPDPDETAVAGSQLRELHTGDKVKRGDLLGVFYSDTVGSKKNDLFDAEMQLRLDKEILDHAENSPATTEVFVWNARRNVEGDVNNVNRAVNTLRTWDISEKDIQAIIDAAKASVGSHTLIDKTKLEEWGRIELRALEDGVLVERNIAPNELIQDPTVSLFQIANVSRLQVIANAAEDDLATLLRVPREKRYWTVHTVNAPPEGIEAAIDDIGYLIDPNQHSAVVKGYLPNPGGKMRGAQLVTASVPLDPPADVVEVDVHAVMDDGSGHTYVFVQADAQKSQYTLRRVQVTNRYDKVVYVTSRFPDAETLFRRLDEAADGKIGRKQFRLLFSDRTLGLPEKVRGNEKLQDEFFDKYAGGKGSFMGLDQFKALWKDLRKQAEDEEKAQGLPPLEPLHEGDKLLKAGVLELKKELEDRESDADKGS